MATDEQATRASNKRLKKAAKQSALEGFGVPDKPTVAMGWDEVNPELIARAVVAFTALGGAIMFGQSRDGGALQIVLYLDDTKKSIWLAGDADLDGEVFKIIQRAEALR